MRTSTTTKHKTIQSDRLLSPEEEEEDWILKLDHGIRAGRQDLSWAFRTVAIKIKYRHHLISQRVFPFLFLFLFFFIYFSGRWRHPNSGKNFSSNERTDERTNGLGEDGHEMILLLRVVDCWGMWSVISDGRAVVTVAVGARSVCHLFYLFIYLFFLVVTFRDMRREESKKEKEIKWLTTAPGGSIKQGIDQGPQQQRIALTAHGCTPFLLPSTYGCV